MHVAWKPPKKLKIHENTSSRTPLEDPWGSQMMSKIEKKIDPRHLGVHMASPNLSRTPPGFPGTPLDLPPAFFFNIFPYLFMCKTTCKTASFLFLTTYEKKNAVAPPVE